MAAEYIVRLFDMRRVTKRHDCIQGYCRFQSTPSMRRVTFLFDTFRSNCQFQSTPSMRRVTLHRLYPSIVEGISIHTLHAEGDIIGQGVKQLTINFNPHPPCGGWLNGLAKEYNVSKFQSTPSMRRVTRMGKSLKYELVYFNPHPPCGGWRFSSMPASVAMTFQSTPSMRRVTSDILTLSFVTEFQSTPSMRRVTVSNNRTLSIEKISIHTLHAEGDKRLADALQCRPISIHTLHAEGDQGSMNRKRWVNVFQSTPSMRRVTTVALYLGTQQWISIHTLHAEGDEAGACNVGG